MPTFSALASAEEERASTAKWAVLQALLARGLRHLGGCSFRQLPVLLTHVGDELLKVCVLAFCLPCCGIFGGVAFRWDAPSASCPCHC